ncbi:MAG TPA: radical SAM protein [Pelolinea sp.]|nr:radical SAM protein [Pelolinea sp.]
MKDNKKIDLRETELTGIINRESMDILAEVVGKSIWKEYRDQYDKASRLELETNYPLQLDFELNASCNLRCPMCPLSAETNVGKGKETWFKFDDFKRILDQGVQHGLKAIKLNYINEPLIRKDIPRFISYAREAGIVDIYLSTNGLLLTDEFIKDLIEAGLTRIQVSIDACTADIYDKVRPGGNFSKVVENVEHLARIRDELGSITPLIRVNFVRTERNEHELKCFIDFWIDKVDMIGIQEMIKPPVSSTEIKSKTTHDKRKEGFRCSFPFKQIVINNEGDILPCCTFYGEQLKMGNIRDDTIIDVWNSKKMKTLRKLHKDGKYYENEVCRKCVEDAITDIE